MKPFVANRYGRLVLPFNFFPQLDFSVFETLEPFAAVIKRDSEEEDPSEADIVARKRVAAGKVPLGALRHEARGHALGCSAACSKGQDVRRGHRTP